MPLTTTYGPNSVTTATDRISVPTFQAPQGGGGLDLTGFMNEMLRQKRRAANQMQTRALTPNPSIVSREEAMARSGGGAEGRVSQSAIDAHKKFMMNAEQEKQRQLLGGAPMTHSQVGTQTFETPYLNRMSAIQRQAFLPQESEFEAGGRSANEETQAIKERIAAQAEADRQRMALLTGAQGGNERAGYFGSGR